MCEGRERNDAKSKFGMTQCERESESNIEYEEQEENYQTNLLFRVYSEVCSTLCRRRTHNRCELVR